MSMEDDLFNVPDNDDDMNDDDDEELDNDNEDNRVDNQGDDNSDNDNENEDDDEDEDDEEDEDDDDEDDDDDDDNDNDQANDDDANDDADDSKFVDAQENHDSPSKTSTAPEKTSPEVDDADNADEDSEVSSDDDADVDAMAVDSDIPVRQALIQKAQQTYDLEIIPSVAMPHASQCHAVAFTDGPKWIITGGEDGFIRKYDFIASIEGKSPLTMAQKHNLVDSVTKAGVICSYWENEQPMTKNELMVINPKVKTSDFTAGTISYEPKVNPVYALEVERNGYWCLSGVLSGGISLYTMRYNEGSLHHYFRHGVKKTAPSLAGGHNDAISCLKLNQSQDRLLSGSWDKTIREWDLQSGKCTTLFASSSGQISQIQFRPHGLSDLIVSYEDAEDMENNSDMGSLFGDSDNEQNDDVQRDTEKPKKVNPNKNGNSKVYRSESVFMSSSSDGTVNIWDLRTGTAPILKYGIPSGTPPWCMSSTWSNNGDFIYVGRRNSTVEEFSLKMPHKRDTKANFVPNVSKTLQFPKISGPVTAISTMPNENYLLCGSSDNIRLYDLSLYNPENPTVATKDSKKGQATPFLIVPGHHGGVLSSLYVDETGRFMVSASGNRGWGNASYTDSVLVYEIDF
ncbi:Transcription factor spt8 [Yamadazyma tenuis]|uniref:Transcription factor spt8 n=1 Tax=Candida tenuis TaxID=2315449 RepID=UPI0027A580E1|nr:Transcription factor spt8 [Yamadazyma tenuis]